MSLNILKQICCATLIALVLSPSLSSARFQDGYGPREQRRFTHLSYPPARRDDQVDTYHGIEVPDPYRWLEDTQAKESQDWSMAEEDLTREFTSRVPANKAIHDRISQLVNYDLYSAPRLLNPPLIKRNGRYFFSKVAAGSSNPVLYVRESIGVAPRVVFDAEARYRDDKLNLVGFMPSPDGHFVACTLASDQSSWLQLRIVKVDDGSELPNALNGLHVAGGSISWSKDSKGFFYTAFDKPAEGTQQRATVKNPKIYYHTIGQAQANDGLIYTRPDKPAWLYTYLVTDDGRYLVVICAEGSSQQKQVFYKDLTAHNGELVSLVNEADADYTLLGSEGPVFWFYTDLHAPRGRIVAIDTTRPLPDHWIEVVPEGREAIAGRSSVGGNALGMFGNRFVLMYLRDGRPLLRVFDSKGHLQQEINLPAGGSIWGGLSGEQHDGEVFYQYLGLTDPSTIYWLDVAKGQNSVFIRSNAEFNPDNYVIDQVFYKSKDGTRVPMFVAHRKGLRLNGNNPAYMYGYGAFGWLSFVWYQPQIIAWLDMGGIYAQPSIRGGGEYGEAWHQAGMKLNKQNAIDDYVEAARWLIDNKYTSPAKLVANGGSASGALAGAAIEQHPELFGASVIDRPVLDLLRFDKFTAASYWKPEFGSPSNPEEFKALRAYSPYHNLERGRCYPPTLIMVGDKDQIAFPAHAYKFTAAMQTAQGCDNPVLLKIMHGAGHNFGATPQQNADNWTEELSFLVRVLRMEASGLLIKSAAR
jgi:prolyl oligopeptidase